MLGEQTLHVGVRQQHTQRRTAATLQCERGFLPLFIQLQVVASDRANDAIQ